MFNQKTKMSFTLERALNLLRIIEKREEISQREVAESMDVSLGTANQTIRALVGEGVLETAIVTTSKGKRGQTYHLTPTGHAQRKELAQLRLKEIDEEMVLLKKEITVLKQETD
jgi:DNA-binding MarR family transcriptional regulator